MFFPIGDEPNPRGLAVVNWLFIILNVAVYALLTFPMSVTAATPADAGYADYVEMLRQLAPNAAVFRDAVRSVSQWDLFVLEHGFRPAFPGVEDLFTSMFMHAGFMHLAGNMLFLWIYGDNVEARLGRVTYALTYLGAGAAGTLLHAVLSGGAGQPLVGASGAISGVLGAYFLFFPTNRIRILLVLLPIYIGVQKLGARWVLGAYFLLDNLAPMLLGSGGPVAYGAHIGGFLAGFLVARHVLNRDTGNGKEAHRWLEAHHHRDMGESVHAADRLPAAVAQSLAAGDVADATQRYLDKWDDPASWRVPTTDVLVMADWLADQREARLALGLYARVLHTARRGPDAAHACAGSGRVYLELLNLPADAWQCFQRALAAGPDPHTEAVARNGLAAIQQMQKLPLRRFDRA